MKINVREARKNFSSLLASAEQGEEIVILKHGKEIARLVPPVIVPKKLPSMKAFRGTIKVEGKPLSRVIIEEREGARY